MPIPFTLSPAPRKGQGPYGLVPGEQGLPDPFADLAKVYPGLAQSNAQASQNIMSELQGELPPDVIAAIQDEAARFGLTSGMPGSDLARRKGARNLGLTSLGLTQRGLQDYLGATQGIKATQTVDPGLQANIAAGNAVYNAAPDPEAAANELANRYRSGLGNIGGGGGISVNPGMPNLRLPASGGPGAPGQTPIYTGSTAGTRPGDFTGAQLPVGGAGPYAGSSGVNPWTGMPTGQLPNEGDNWDFGLDWGGVGPDQGFDQSLIDLGSQTPDYNPGQFNLYSDPFGFGGGFGETDFSNFDDGLNWDEVAPDYYNEFDFEGG